MRESYFTWGRRRTKLCKSSGIYVTPLTLNDLRRGCLLLKPQLFSCCIKPQENVVRKHTQEEKRVKHLE